MLEGEDADIILVAQGYPLSFTGSSRLPRSKVLISGAGLSFSLFYFSMNNTSKIPLPHHTAVNYCIYINTVSTLLYYKD